MPTTAESTPPSTPVRHPRGAVRVRSSCACIGRTRLHYRVAGEGPPLVLVHGYGAASSWWRHNIRPLAEEQRRVYAPDLGGFGRSWPKQQFSLERTVECLDIPRGAALTTHLRSGSPATDGRAPPRRRASPGPRVPAYL